MDAAAVVAVTADFGNAGVDRLCAGRPPSPPSMIRLDAAALDGAISIASTQHGQCATAVLVVRFKTLPPLNRARAHRLIRTVL